MIPKKYIAENEKKQINYSFIFINWKLKIDMPTNMKHIISKSIQI